MDQTGNFGQWLKQRRKALGLTQKALAQQAGCAEVTLRKIEAGNLQPSAPLVASLAQALGVDDADLPTLVSLARGLDDDFAARTRFLRPQRPNNLPAQLTPLIGRAHDVSAVRKRLVADGARLVTLVGPPGVGKTRLSLAVAADVLEQFDDGVFFVQLGPISDPSLVAAAIAQTLGVQMSGPNPPELQLRAYLEEKNLLLVLDNFEQVVAAAPLVDDLLRRGPWLHVLVTSRQPLRVRGERQIQVLPLALPTEMVEPGAVTAADMLRYPSVALFAERAEAVLPDFAVDDDNAHAVAELCRRLDGLPLAIELVAARVKLLPPADLLARLHGPWLLSADGLRDVSARQKTLRGAIGWSYDLLSPMEQTLFTRLAVFVGGCTMEAVEMVCGSGVLDGIASLLDNSLLYRQTEVSGQARYVMLDIVREYALEKLTTESNEVEVRSRHMAWCLTVAKAAAPSPFGIFEQTSWDRLDAEIHNLRAGLDWAFYCDSDVAVQLVQATSRYLASRGSVAEARFNTNRALEMYRATDRNAVRAELLYHKGAAEFVAVDFGAAEASMTEALEICSELDLIPGQAGAQYYLGRLASIAGDAQRAEEFLERSLAAYQEVGDTVEHRNVMSVLGENAMFRGDLTRSRMLHTSALAGHLPLTQRSNVIWSLGGLAEVALVEGDLITAQELAAEFLLVCRKRGNPGEIAWAMTCLGEIAIRRHDYATARACLHEALSFGRFGDSAWRIPIITANLGDLATVEGRPHDALRLYQKSLPRMLEFGIFNHPPGSLRLAYLAESVEQHAVATALLAACQTAVEKRAEVLLPITHADFDQVLTKAQAALDMPSFERAWSKGRSLNQQAALAYGLDSIQLPK